MLRSHFEFACVLCIIFISSVSSASFGDFCSNDLSCQDSLICSNSSECICSISTSFWNVKQNACLACSQDWTEWQTEKCLLFIAPADGGINRREARNICLSQTGQLLQIDNYQDFMQFQYKTDELMEGQYGDILIEFLNNGVWVNFTDKWLNSYEWCRTEYEDDIPPWNDCIRITRRDSLLCLSHVQCDESLSYICEKSAQIEDDRNETKSDERFFNIVGDLLGSIFSPGQKPTNPPPTPQIIYQTHPPPIVQPQSSGSNILLYVGIGGAVFILILLLLCCCFGGGFFLWKSNDSSSAPVPPSRSRRRRDRTSVASAASDATY